MKKTINTLIAAFCLTAGAAHAADPFTGTLRIGGSDQMNSLLACWEQGFAKLHPGVRFEHWLKGSGTGMYGLEMRTTDLALMGRPINPYERYGIYERAWVYPLEIEVATGAVSQSHKSPAYAIFVNKSNPLAQLTMQQLDGIFGAERGGGWKALTWDESAAHSKDQNIRNWGQLGLTGEWAGKSIHTYHQTSVMGEALRPSRDDLISLATKVALPLAESVEVIDKTCSIADGLAMALEQADVRKVTRQTIHSAVTANLLRCGI